MYDAVLPAAGIRCAARRRQSFNYRLGVFVLRRYRLCTLLILALAVVNCFWHLSSNVISDLDEARYGVASSEMLRNHSALVATYAGQPEYWNLKPPLGYWLQELSYKALGPTVLAMRLPSALCAISVIALTMGICRSWFGRRPALLAGLILTTCYGLVSYHGFRSGDLDSPLTLIMLIAVIQAPRLIHSSAARLLWAGMFGLGFLLKSFAILPFAATTIIYLAWSGDWRWVRPQQWLPGVALLAGVILSWVLARSLVDHSTYFVSRMVREDLVGRSTSVIDVETYSPWAYVAVLLDRFAPWPVFIVGALLLGKRTDPDARPRYARLVQLWAVVPLIAFSLARTQHHWYLDPAYPAWSILAAGASLSLIASSQGRGRQFAIALIVVGMLFCEARVLFRVCRTDRRPPGQTFLLSLRDRLRPASGTTVEAAFPLSHSERFILQVVDGYRVEEPGVPLPATTLDTLPTGPRVRLIHARDARTPSARDLVVAAGAGYVVLKAVDR